MSTTRYTNYTWEQGGPDPYDAEPNDDTEEPVQTAVVTSFVRRDGDRFLFRTDDGWDLLYEAPAGSILLHLLEVDGEVVVTVDPFQIRRPS